MGFYASNKTPLRFSLRQKNDTINFSEKVLRLNPTKNRYILDFVLVTLPTQSSSLGLRYLTDVLNTCGAQAFARQTGMNRAAGAQGAQLWGETSRSTMIVRDLLQWRSCGPSGDAEAGVSAGGEAAFPAEMALS